MLGPVLGAKESMMRRAHLEAALKQLMIYLEQWFSVLAAYHSRPEDFSKRPMSSSPIPGQLNKNL